MSGLLDPFTARLRFLWKAYLDHKNAFDLLSITFTGTLALLAHFAPGVLDLIGATFVVAWNSDSTHTFLLLAMIFGYMTPGAETTQARVDGGEDSGIMTLGWAFFFGSAGAMIASSFGNEWVLPGFMAVFTVFLILEG